MEFVQHMDHHAFVCLDNVSSLPEWASDWLCRATTGGGYQKRRLYTDDDDITYYFRRVFILNGISVPATAPDLLDRSITIELSRIDKKDRKRLSRLRKSFEADLPDILGGILDVMVQVIARRDEELEEQPRLADWYGLAYVAAEILGVKEDFVAAFDASEKEQHKAVVESNLVSELLVEFMEGEDSWDGKKMDLHAELSKMAEERGTKREWPKTVSVFGKKLKKFAHNLAEMGIHMTDYTDGNARRITITKGEKPQLGEEANASLAAGEKVPGSGVNAVSPVNGPDNGLIERTATETVVRLDTSDGISLSDQKVPAASVPAEEKCPPMPEKDKGWPEDMQGLHCELSDMNKGPGVIREEAD